MQYVAPKAEVVKFDVASVILNSNLCLADDYWGGELWEDEKSGTAINSDFLDLYN